MKLFWTNSKNRWKDSFTVSLAIMVGVQTVIEAFSLNNLWHWNDLTWWIRLLITFGVYICLLIATFVIKCYRTRNGIKIVTNDNVVHIKSKDIFDTSGLKLIPFNEYFDTTVDDIIIAHNSLNGKFLDNYVDDIDDLISVIENSESQSSTLKPYIKGNRKCYPLGKIVKYKNEFLLLAFTHFVNNEAHLTHNDFEKCLLNMWKEIERVYANRPIFIPLLGSGITRFDDTPHKSYENLIKCIICTLKMSNVHIKQPITLCLTDETFNKINIYELK